MVACCVGLMLAVGLCAVGGGFDTHVSNAQIFASYRGAGLGLASLIALIIGNARLPKKDREK